MAINCIQSSSPAPDNCCSVQVLLWEECVARCLHGALQPTHLSLHDKYSNAVAMGDRSEHILQAIQDLQILETTLMAMWKERVLAFEGGRSLTMESLWNSYEMSCVTDYFQCRHGFSITEAALQVGVYDPLNPPSPLPNVPAFNGPCGEDPPVPAPPPPVYPFECDELTFPAIRGEYQSPNMRILSNDPSFHTGHWTIDVEAYANGVWSILYSGSDEELSMFGIVRPLIPDTSLVRSTFKAEGCTYGPFETVADPCSITPSFEVITIMTTEGLERMHTGEDYYLDLFFTGYYYDEESVIQHVPVRIMITDDPNGFLEGSPSPFEIKFGVPPPFGTYEIVDVLTDFGQDFISANISFQAVSPVVNGMYIENLDMSYDHPNIGDGSSESDPYKSYSHNSVGVYPNSADPSFQEPLGVFRAQPGSLSMVIGNVSLISLGYGSYQISIPDEMVGSGQTIRIEVCNDRHQEEWVFLQDIPASDFDDPVEVPLGPFAIYVRCTIIYNGDCEWQLYPIELSPIEIVIWAPKARPNDSVPAPMASIVYMSSRHTDPFGEIDTPYPLFVGNQALGETPPLDVSFIRCVIGTGLDVSNPMPRPIGDRWMAVGSYSAIHPGLHPPNSPNYHPNWAIANGPVIYSTEVPNLNGETITSITTTFNQYTNYPSVGHVTYQWLAAGGHTLLFLNERVKDGSIQNSGVALVASIIPGGWSDYMIRSACNAKKDYAVVSITEVGGPGSILYFTTNRGSSWTACSGGPASGQYFIVIQNITDTIVVALSSDGKIYRSADSGLTWTEVFTGASGHNFAMFDTEIIMVGNFRSEDSGFTWVEKTAPPGEVNFSTMVLDSRVLLYGGESLWFSYDGGNTLSLYPQQPDGGFNLMRAANAWFNP